MEIFSNLYNGSSRKNWRRSRYQRIGGAIKNRKSTKTIRIGDRPKTSVGVKLVPKLRLKMVTLSPLKILRKLKNAYVNMMVNLAGNVEHLNNGNALAGKRIPKPRQPKTVYSNREFDSRLIFEIYKTLAVSLELGYN